MRKQAVTLMMDLTQLHQMVSPSLVGNNYYTQGLQLTKTTEEFSPQQIAYTFWYYEGKPERKNY